VADEYLCGLDEAGRGPLLGPMFLAAVRFPSPRSLSGLPLMDSKAYGSGPRARAMRRHLAERIMSLAEFRLVEISAARIDEYVLRRGGLNLLEQTAAAALLSSLAPAQAVAADGETLFGPLKDRFPLLYAANKADALFPAVSAASILAKNARDLWFEAFAALMTERFGLVISGGGYVNAGTDAFIEAFQRLTGHLPPHLRRSWRRQPRALQLPI